jgi:uncharacterized RDD family membrane protein YckC
MAERTLSDKPLHVTPEFVGAPLASPLRRFIALAVDLAIVMIPALAVAVAVAAISLRMSDPAAFRAIGILLRHEPAGTPSRVSAFKAVLPMLARHEAPGLPCEARQAVEEGRVDDAFERIRDYDFLFTLQLEESAERQLSPKSIRIDIGSLIPRSIRFLALYGVAAAYFVFFTCSAAGATPGKRLLRIRVVRMDGHRLSLLEGLERFIGYLHIPATLGISVLDLWRDPNRRMPHDRTVHTAVVRR